MLYDGMHMAYDGCIWASHGLICGQYRLRMLYDGTHLAFVCCMMAFLLSICVECVFLVACDGYVCGVRVCGVSVPASLRWLVASVLLLVVVSSMGYYDCIYMAYDGFIWLKM